MARVKNNKQATNVAREYIKDMNKNKVASIILLLFLVVFLFNLLKFNRKVPVGKDEIEKNKKSVEALQKSSVTSVVRLFLHSAERCLQMGRATRLDT